MGLLRELVQTIVVIVLLAVFIEMALPRGDMRRYVKMVMGLLVILAVVQAAAGALNSGLLGDMPRLTESGAAGTTSLDEIMAAGEKLSESNQDEAVRRYEEGIAGQVLSLARLNQKVDAVDAVVETGSDANEINKITLVFKAGGKKEAAYESEGVVVDIKPVVVEVGDQGGVSFDMQEKVEPGPEEKKAASEVAAGVAEFFNLGPEQVECRFK